MRVRQEEFQSLDFTINRFVMKLFKIYDIEVVKDCQISFNFELPTALLVKRSDKFIVCCVGTDVQFSSVCDKVCSFEAVEDNPSSTWYINVDRNWE